MDLSAGGGPEQGWIIDGIFQEVDIETGELLFEWRASEHVPLEDTMLDLDESTARTPGEALDFFHINSVDKDVATGNYVISGRHTFSVMCVDPAGNTIWTLGGDDNSFRDLSGGRATDFTWQHHARLVGNTSTTIPTTTTTTTTLLSLFDNGKSEGDDYIGAYSRGMLVELDLATMTARLAQEYADPQRSRLAQSQGSAQALPHSGRMLVSYGFLPVFTEFDAGGAVVCDVHLAPRAISTFGMVTSYRAYKSASWVGRPVPPPSVFLRPADRRVYASWHGATEIARWVLEGADWEGASEGRYVHVDGKKKAEFEVSFAITDAMPPYLRVAALDKDGEVLGRTEVLHKDRGNAPSTKTRDTVVAIATFSCLLAVAFVFRKMIRRALKSRLAGKLVGPIVRGVWWDRRGANPHEVQPLYKI